MPKTVEVEVHVADLKPMQQFIGAVAQLLRALPAAGPLPPSVMNAADEVRKAVAALGGRDIGPPPVFPAEDVISWAQAEAQKYPGRVGRA